jgi:hypothetical protein
VSAQPGIPPKRPRGRPPARYVWCNGRYVHEDSQAPYRRDEHEAMMLELWNQMRLQRYKEDARGFRSKRIETQAQARIAKGVKPRRKLKNATLVRSPGQKVNGGTDKS